MTEQTYTVEGMTCAHCAAAVTREIERIEGVTGVRVDVTAGTVTVGSRGDQPADAIAAAVDEAGYTLVAGR